MSEELGNLFVLAKASHSCDSGSGGTLKTQRNGPSCRPGQLEEGSGGSGLHGDRRLTRQSWEGRVVVKLFQADGKSRGKLLIADINCKWTL